jgi:hypothetical protein
MTHKKYVYCCHALDEDAFKVLGCDSKSKLAFEATTQVDTMVCGVDYFPESATLSNASIG